MQSWRKWLLGMAIAWGVLTGLRRGPSFEARVAPAVKRRRVSDDESRQRRQPATPHAQAASLWRYGAMGGCAVSARWSDRPVAAEFSAVICMEGSMTIKRAFYKPVAAPVQLGADCFSAALQPGAAAKIRLVKSAAFKAKRVLYGGVELRAAA